MTIYQPIPLPPDFDVEPGTPQSIEIDDDLWPSFQANGWLAEEPVTDPSFLFNSSELTTDDYLTFWESKMPAQAKTVGVFNGKRLLAKNFLRKTLLKQGIDAESLENPSGELKDAATFKELELIYRDMSQTPDSIAGQKASYYSKLFESEMELIILSVSTSAGETLVRPTCSSIPLYLA